MNCRINQKGVTLIELIIAIVVISVALSGILLVINYTTRHSADALLRHQAIAIAEAYLEEIALKAFVDPDDSQLCPAPEGSRTAYDNVCDYNGLGDAGARDQTGSQIAGLGSYQVSVTVVPQAFGGIGVNDALRIDVSVTDPQGNSLQLGRYRTRY